MHRDRVVQVLDRQHNRVRRSMTVVWATTGASRRDALSALISLLAFHLVAEDELTGTHLDELERLVDAVRTTDIDSVDFVLAFGELEDALEDHASAVLLTVAGAASAAQYQMARRAARRLAQLDGLLGGEGDVSATVRLEDPRQVPFHELRSRARCRFPVVDHVRGQVTAGVRG